MTARRPGNAGPRPVQITKTGSGGYRGKGQYRITVPVAFIEVLGLEDEKYKDYWFIPELSEEGILFRAVKDQPAPTVDAPGWVE